MLKVILTSLFAVLALIGGLILTAFVAAVSVLVLLTRRMFGRGLTQVSPPTAGIDRRGTGGAEIIEVSATELPVDPPPR